MDLRETVIKTIKKYNMLSTGDTVVIGLSGGADSVALFNVLCSLKEEFDLTLHAAHINHMIRGQEADCDSAFAEKTAKDKNVAFHLLKRDIPALSKELGISEEMAGRKVRYEFFREIAPNGKIAVAHHMGDSVETTIFNMIRGSSLKGLKGISPVNENIIRPLIDCRRADIENYLKQINASFVTDSTNELNIYTRNSIRNIIIPQMQKINPNLINTVYENSRLLNDDEDFIAKECDSIAKKLIKKDGETIVLSLDDTLHNAVKRRLIIKCCQIADGKSTISSSAVENILNLSTGSKTSFGNICAERSYDKIIFTNSFSESKCFHYSILPPGTINICETGKCYKFKIAEKGDITAYKKGYIYLDADKLGVLTIRNRKDGDVFTPLGLGGRKKVKDFLIDSKIPRVARYELPVLESDGKIAALLCLRPDDSFKITESTTKILIINEEKSNE